MSQQYKVLVVDDDLKLRSLLERYLTEQGFVVRGVANGEQADRLLTRENFSLMVLDLMLPGEDGLSICRRLREAGNQIPVLMLTAYSPLQRIYHGLQHSHAKSDYKGRN
jgi:two-component system phosphate regulon response regulator OmpR